MNTSQTRESIPSDSIVLEVRELRKDYSTDGAAVHALRGVDLSVRSGEMIAVMGASGSGKSTLIHLIGGLDTPTAGTVTIEGRNLGELKDRDRTLFRRRRLGIVFQAYNLLPSLTAWENVGLPAMVDGAAGPQMESKARSLLDTVGLSHRAEHRPQAMSGGEQQRVAIARALMNDPALILADEPTGNLDSHFGNAIWHLLSDLVRHHRRTVLVVTHEANRASFADRVIVLKDGRLAGEIEPDGEDHASLVATRYTELVG